MKKINNYILLVDSHKNPKQRHSTYGRYRVGAKNEKEAVELLRNRIKFGSIQIYYKCMDNDIKINYREIVQECFTENGFEYKEPQSATAQRKGV